jgi:hypothetical protein
MVQTVLCFLFAISKKARNQAEQGAAIFRHGIFLEAAFSESLLYSWKTRQL